MYGRGSENEGTPVDHNWDTSRGGTKRVNAERNSEDDTKFGLDENDVDSLWKEIKNLGSLPVDEKDECQKEVTNTISRNSSQSSVSKFPEQTNKAAGSIIRIPIQRGRKAKDTDERDEDEVILNKQVINLKIQETDVKTEKNASKKQTKSSMKTSSNTKIPISIKIPINHEKFPSEKSDGCEHSCPGVGGQDDDEPLHSVSTQTDKNGCWLM